VNFARAWTSGRLPRRIPLAPRIALYWALASATLFALDPNRTLTQYTHAVWTEAQGLPQDYIHAITQTTDGFLWIGTDEGLTRFDGYDFVTFTRESGALPTNTVTTLAAGADGTLWIGTPDGLSRYSNQRFTKFDTNDGLPDRSILSLCQDQSGTLWIATGVHLIRFKDGKFTNFRMEDLKPLTTARSIYEDRHGRLFVAGMGGVIERRGDTFVQVFGPKEMGEQTVASLTEDSNGSLWLAGGYGVLRHTADGKMKLFGTRDGLPNRRVRDVWADRNGNIWVGTSGGLSRLEGNRFVTTPVDSDHDLDVRCFFEDREGDLWVGTNSGLDRFRDDRFVMYGRAEGLPSDQPIAVHQDRKGSIWVGYHNSGLVEFRGQDYWVYTTRDGLPSDELFAIRETRDGDLLLSTREGLSRMHNGHFSNYALPEILERRQIYDALEDDRGRIWVAAPGGVFQMTAHGFRSAVPGGPFQNDSADMLSEGPDGSIWAGTLGAGIWRIKDGDARKFTTADGLGSDRIRSLYQDPDGTVWIGTLDGGLNAYRDGKIVRYTARDGLLSDNVSHIEDDGKGALWLSTTHGISRVSKQQLRDFAEGRVPRLTPVNYGMDDGLRSAQCAPGYPVNGGGTRTRDGRLWFPTAHGLAMLDPAVSSQEAPAPLVQILDVAADGQDVGTGPETRIKPSAEQVQFRYTGIHLSAPERVTYYYKLEGLDHNWISAGSRRVVSYNTLGHGHYRFVVRASVPGLPLSEASFGFEVLPHFYDKAWFLSLCAASFIAAIYGLYQLRLKQIRGRFSLVLEERVRMAREIHDTLAQGFVGISSQLDALALKMNGDGEPAGRQRDLAQRLEIAQKMARHSLTEARRSLMDLRSSDLSDRDLASALTAAARHWAAGSPVAVHTRIAGARLNLPEEVEHNVLRIAQEAVTNALKHAGAKNLWIDLRVDARSLELVIRDDGSGFEHSRAFVSVGGHFGLLGMRERAERIGGELKLSSEPGSGTEVRVNVPLASEDGREGARQRFWSMMRVAARAGRS
jgi:signal transduction histidine kinase/ligand-binding sensor domain-containing protein